jgi:hypothetical protein
MLFDVQAALAEILNDTPEAAIPAIPAISPGRIAGIAGIAAGPAEIQTPAEVLPFPPSAPGIPRHEPDDSPHGHCRITGRPRTWTGRVVSLDEWRRLSAWDRHGSTGKLWNGITRQWEPDGGAA